jgi:hypothetical protein
MLAFVIVFNDQLDPALGKAAHRKTPFRFAFRAL